jgi:hypothetical protein
MEAKLKLFKKTVKMLLHDLMFIFGCRHPDKNQMTRANERFGKLHELLYDFEKELAFIRADGEKVYEVFYDRSKHFLPEKEAFETNFIRRIEVKRKVEEPKEEKFDAAKFWDDHSLFYSCFISKDEFMKLQKSAIKVLKEDIISPSKAWKYVDDLIEIHIRQRQINREMELLDHIIEIQNKQKERCKKYKEGTEWKVCKNCKSFRETHFPVIAPIKNMIADGICENKNQDVQPIVLDCKKDTCNYFQFK